MASSSTFEINDTLQLTKEQGFPVELDIEKHKVNPYQLDNIKDKVFHFSSKQGLRIFVVTPVRVFLVENIEGKWVYWGLINILNIQIDYINRVTSGSFKIIKINTVEEMQQTFNLVDGNFYTNYFNI